MAAALQGGLYTHRAYILLHNRFSIVKRNYFHYINFFLAEDNKNMLKEQANYRKQCYPFKSTYTGYVMLKDPIETVNLNPTKFKAVNANDVVEMRRFWLSIG